MDDLYDFSKAKTVAVYEQTIEETRKAFNLPEGYPIADGKILCDKQGNPIIVKNKWYRNKKSCRSY